METVRKSSQNASTEGNAFIFSTRLELFEWKNKIMYAVKKNGSIQQHYWLLNPSRVRLADFKAA